MTKRNDSGPAFPRQLPNVKVPPEEAEWLIFRHAMNTQLYAIDVALVGKSEAPKRWQIRSQLFPDWQNAVNAVQLKHWPEYRRDPSAPALPSWDWHELPANAAFRTVNSTGDRECWAMQPLFGSRVWLKDEASLKDSECGLNGRFFVGKRGDWKQSLEPRPPRAWFDATANISRDQYEALKRFSRGETLAPASDEPADDDVQPTDDQAAEAIDRAVLGGGRTPLRDWFAGQALPAVISATSAGQHHPGKESNLPPGSGTEVRLAFDAYALADAMLAERERDGDS